MSSPTRQDQTEEGPDRLFPESPDLDDPAFDDPLDILLAEHARQQVICDRLDLLADGLDTAPLAEKASEIIAFLEHELAHHTLDEERGLFPRLRRRCRPEDGFELVVERLMAEHALDHDLVDFLVADLELLATGHRLANPMRFLMNVRAFTETQRRHLAWENATVIPLARRRLTPEDLSSLRANMAVHRQLDEPSSGNPSGAT